MAAARSSDSEALSEPRGPRILSDSSMWQSPEWNRAVESVYSQRSRFKWLNHPLLLGLRLFAGRPGAAIVLSTGNQGSMLYGLLCRLFFLPQRQVVNQLYLNERSGIWGWHDPVMRFVLKGAWGVIVTSRGEIEAVEQRFGVPRDRIRFVPYHTNVIDPEFVGSSDGPVFAGGRNFRDYASLVEATRSLQREVVIVCGHEHLRGVPLGSHVRVLREIPYEEYMAELRRASVVVIPLSIENVPSGQVAILEAMGYGKPVITTRSVGTVDYVRDGVDGLLYRLGDVADLAEKIECLSRDDELRERMGRAAFESVLAQFTFERHVETKLQALQELAVAGQGAVTTSSDS